MNVLQQFLDGRDDERRDQDAADERWLQVRGGVDAAERLQSWDRWLRGKLLSTLVWPTDEVACDRLVRQCAVEITTLARQLRGRGWLLDGKALAMHVDAVLVPIGKAQRAGKVGDFWPYFRAAVGRYVGANAEEIQQHARRTNADEGAQTVGAVLAGLRLAGDSMTELLCRRAGEVRQAKEESLRVRQARLRAKEAAQRADDSEPTLF